MGLQVGCAFPHIGFSHTAPPLLACFLSAPVKGDVAFIFLWLPRVEHIARNFLAFLLLSLFCAPGGFSRVPDAMELSV